jgi:hypothetical protein
VNQTLSHSYLTRLLGATSGGSFLPTSRKMRERLLGRPAHKRHQGAREMARRAKRLPKALPSEVEQ